jgi:hypothetical protein
MMEAVGKQALEEGVKYGASVTMDYGRFATLIQRLVDHSTKHTNLDAGSSWRDRTPTMIISPHLNHMLNAYAFSGTGTGVTWVMYAPTDSGKTAAAEYLLHGNHKFRPTRALKISAASMQDFAHEYTEKKLNCTPAGNCFHTILIDALVNQPSMASMLAGGADNLQRVMACSPQSTNVISHKEQDPVTIRGNEVYTFDEDCAAEICAKRPVLIIDDFNCDTEANRSFLFQLFTKAASNKVVVFILTKEKDWATEMIGLNGGTKIMPLYGNVNNADFAISGPFEGNPEWNSLVWSVEGLRDLIRPLCEKDHVDPECVVKDGEPCTPGVALRRIPVEAYALKLAEKKKTANEGSGSKTE